MVAQQAAYPATQDIACDSKEERKVDEEKEASSKEHIAQSLRGKVVTNALGGNIGTRSFMAAEKREIVPLSGSAKQALTQSLPCQG